MCVFLLNLPFFFFFLSEITKKEAESGNHISMGGNVPQICAKLFLFCFVFVFVFKYKKTLHSGNLL